MGASHDKFENAIVPENLELLANLGSEVAVPGREGRQPPLERVSVDEGELMWEQPDAGEEVGEPASGLDGLDFREFELVS